MKKILIISLLTFFRLGLLRARNAGYAAPAPVAASRPFNGERGGGAWQCRGFGPWACCVVGSDYVDTAP